MWHGREWIAQESDGIFGVQGRLEWEGYVSLRHGGANGADVARGSGRCARETDLGSPNNLKQVRCVLRVDDTRLSEVPSPPS